MFYDFMKLSNAELECEDFRNDNWIEGHYKIKKNKKPSSKKKNFKKKKRS